MSSSYPEFSDFFEHWLSEQGRHLQDLLATAASASGREDGDNADEEDRRIRALVSRVIGHYEEYYRAKSTAVKEDVRPMLNPPWTSSTEKLFLWIGGWRPSAAFHLLYSKSGLQLEPKLESLVRGMPTGDLADLSSAEFESVNRLHLDTIGVEKEISEMEAAVHETVADPAVVAISNVAELSREAMEVEMRQKGEAMVRVLERANQLRIRTLKRMVEILRPIQAVHFLIAAAELHLRVHEFGKCRDEESSASS